MRYLRLITEHWLVLLITTVVSAAIAVGVSFIPDQLYESEVELLIVQQATTDTYTAQRAAEKLGKNLITVIGSFDFLGRVIATEYISEDMFSDNPKQKAKQWSKQVEAQVVPETGIIKVSGFGISPGQAEDVVLGVTQVLTTNSSDYHGAGETVSIKHISGPITSSRPVKPNIPLNGVAAGVLGFMAGYTYFLLRFEAQRAAQEKEQQQVTQQSAAIHYQLPVNQKEIFPLGPPEYKVLDEFPQEPFTYGAKLEDAPNNTPPSKQTSTNEGAEIIAMPDYVEIKDDETKV